MTELSLYVLDIVQNSISAKASHIKITLAEVNKLMTFSVEDNGAGMSPALVLKVLDPFTTTRTTRKVGLGLPFLKMAAEQTGGKLVINSELGVGTVLIAEFVANHIDMVPLGDFAGTVTTLIQGAPLVHFTIKRVLNNKSYTLDTEDMKEVLGDDVPLNSPDVLAWLSDFVNENEANLL